MLNYDFKYVTHKRKGFYGRQLFNSAFPSTYLEHYTIRRYPKLSTATAVVWGIVVIMCAWGIYVLVFQ